MAALSVLHIWKPDAKGCIVEAMAENKTLPMPLRVLDEKQRKFVSTFVSTGNAEAATSASGYEITSQYYLLRRPDIIAAIRFEVQRRLATEGASVGYGAILEVARDEKAPGAARVAAGKALLTAAGLLEAPQAGKEAKSINDMTRDELRDFIEAKRAEVDKMEAALADRAAILNPAGPSQAPDPFS